MRKKPSELSFSQDSISKTFKNGKCLTETLKDFLNGSINPDDIPPVAAKLVKGKWIVCEGNRRLYLYKILEEAGFIDTVPVVYYRGEPNITAIPDVPLEIRSKRDFEHEFDVALSNAKKFIAPLKIYYSEYTLASDFDDGNTLFETFRFLNNQILHRAKGRRTITRNQMPPMKVMKCRGKWIVIDGNRRLFLYQRLQYEGLLTAIPVFCLKDFEPSYCLPYSQDSVILTDTRLLENMDKLVSPQVDRLYPSNNQFSFKVLAPKYWNKAILDIFEELVTGLQTPNSLPRIFVSTYAGKWTVYKLSSLLFLYRKLEIEGLIETVPVTRFTGSKSGRSYTSNPEHSRHVP